MKCKDYRTEPFFETLAEVECILPLTDQSSGVGCALSIHKSGGSS